MADSNGDFYVVSFGDPNNRHYAYFWSYRYAMKFFDECVDAERFNVQFQSANPDEEE